MNPISPSTLVASVAAPSSPSMPLAQWLNQFETVASAHQVLQVAESLHRNLLGEPAQPLNAGSAAEFLRTIKDTDVVTPHLNRPVAEFLPVTDLVRVGDTPLVFTDEPKTWAGRSQSLAGYIGRSGIAHLFHTSGAGQHYAPSEERLSRSLETYEFHAFEEYPDAVERCEAFSREHARNLEWSSQRVSRMLRLVPKETRDFYQETRGKILDLNEQYRDLLDQHDRLLRETDHLEPHEQNVRISDREMEINRQIDTLEKAIYQANMEWEIRFYEGLMEEAERFVVPPTAADREKFQRAIALFRRNAQAELDYRDRLLNNDKEATPSRRKNIEEAAYRSLMHSSKSLNALMRKIYKRIGHPAMGELTGPLSFAWKNQTFRHDSGISNLVALERLVESMVPHGKKINAAQKDPSLLGMLDDLASIGWAIPALADYFGVFRLSAPRGLLTVSQHLSPEASMIRGALAIFGSNSNPVRQEHLDEFTPGVVSDQTHGDTMDYMAILASRHLLWGPQRRGPSIVAESVFKYIPFMGGYLKATTRGFLSRSDRQKREHFLNVTLADLIAQGRDVSQFGEGTRRLSNAFAARYSDLRHPGALHNPSEFLVPGTMRGMQFRLSLANKSDVHVYAAKIHGGGSGEPSIPRDVKGFVTGGYTQFSHRPPYAQNGFVALAGIIRYRDQIKPEDFPGEPMHQILARNVAINRRMLRRVGLNMDAGPPT